jgi:hypothetical protein
MKSEMSVLNEIRLYLSKRGIISLRLNVGKIKTSDGRFFSTGLSPGVSDLLAILPDGKCLFIECKSERGKASKAQLNFLDAVKRQNAYGLIASSVEQVMDYLSEHGY